MESAIAGGGPRRRANTRGREPEHCRICSRRNDGVAEQLVVVLAERPGGVDKHRQEILDQFFRRSWAWQLCRVIGGKPVQNGRAPHRAVVNRCVFMEARGRDIGQDLAVPPLQDPQPPRTSDSAYDGRAHFPTPADLHHGIQHRGCNDREHALLALARHHLERRQARLAQRHGFDVHVHAHPAPRGRFAGGAGDTGAAEILDTEHEVLVEQLKGCLDQALFLERVADLDVRALCRFGFRVIREGRRSQDAHPADPVAPGARTKEHRQAPLATSPPKNEAVLGEEPAAQDVDQRVARVTLSEVELAPDGWDPDGVAVARDTAHHPARDPAVAGVVREAKAQWVHQSDRASAHGEDVAYYPADPGSGPLIWLDRRGVVVAFDADRHGDAVPGVDHSRVLARANQHGRPNRREPAKVEPGGLVRAVLAPHHCVHGQLEVVGHAAQDPLYRSGFFIGQAELAVQRCLHGHQTRLRGQCLPAW